MVWPVRGRDRLHDIEHHALRIGDKRGATGLWIEAGETAGKLTLTARSRRFDTQTISISVT